MTTPTVPTETLESPTTPLGDAAAEAPHDPKSFDLAIVDAYSPGVCNIGPAEIARRRLTGHVGAIASVATLAGLAALRAPRPVRLVVALPAAVAASGYIQAQLHFCAGFGSRGVYNFGEVGETFDVVDARARAADRDRSIRIGLASAAIGAVAGVAATLLPR